MIDLSTESVRTLSQAAKLLPSNHTGKPTHTATLVRWIMNGIRGVRLEATRLGGKWVTSIEALQRFSDKLTREQGVETDPQPTIAQKSAAAKASEELDRLGF